MTHDQLVELGASWLKKKCSVVITEMVTGMETPDVIGFSSQGSIVIECKASRADFLCDRKKFHRRYPEYGMGEERYYLTSEGLINLDVMSDGWGLLETDGKKIRQKSKPATQERNYRAEQALLVSSLRRIGNAIPPGSGMSVRFYTYETQNIATLGVENFSRSARVSKEKEQKNV